MARTDLKIVIKAHAAALHRVGAEQDADLLKRLDGVFTAKGDIFAVDKQIELPHVSASDGSIERALILLEDLTAVLEPAAKRQVLADLGRLKSFLGRHETMSLVDLLNASRTRKPGGQSITQTAERLKACFGAEGFEDELARVLADRRLRQPDLVAIANEMGSTLPARSSKKKVADHLLALHRDMVTFLAKKKSMAGRSAA